MKTVAGYYISYVLLASQNIRLSIISLTMTRSDISGASFAGLQQMKGYLQIIFAVMCNIGWRGKELTERL